MRQSLEDQPPHGDHMAVDQPEMRQAHSSSTPSCGSLAQRSHKPGARAPKALRQRHGHATAKTLHTQGCSLKGRLVESLSRGEEGQSPLGTVRRWLSPSGSSGWGAPSPRVLLSHLEEQQAGRHDQHAQHRAARGHTIIRVIPVSSGKVVVPGQRSGVAAGLMCVCPPLLHSHPSPLARGHSPATVTAVGMAQIRQHHSLECGGQQLRDRDVDHHAGHQPKHERVHQGVQVTALQDGPALQEDGWARRGQHISSQRWQLRQDPVASSSTLPQQQLYKTVRHAPARRRWAR